MQAYHQYGMGWRPACKLQKECTRLTSASDKVYQLLAGGWLFSPGTPASSTTKTGRHDIAEMLLKVALSTIKIVVAPKKTPTLILLIAKKKFNNDVKSTRICNSTFIHWRMFVIHQFVILVGEFPSMRMNGYL
jgi:hypothetical protein